MLPLLAGQPLSSDAEAALRDALQSHTAATHPAGLANELLALALKVRQLTQEKTQLAKEKDAELESLRLHATRTTRTAAPASSTTALQKDFQQGEEVERLRAQVDKLKKTLDFQREKDQRIPLQANERDVPVSDGIAVPSHVVFHGHDLVDNVDLVCSEIHDAIASRNWEKVESTYWVLVANNTALQHRVVQAGACVRQVVALSNQSLHEVAEERALYEKRHAEMLVSHKLAIDDMRAMFLREKSALQTELRVSEEQRQQTTAATLQQQEERLQGAALTLHNDEQKFGSLKTKNGSLQVAVGRYKMREAVLVQLVNKMREEVQALVGMIDARDTTHFAHLQRERQRLEQENASLVQQFQQLPSLEDIASTNTADDVDALVKSTVKATETQLNSLRRDMQILVTNYENYANETRRSEVESHTLRAERDAEKDAVQRMKEECGRLLDDRATLQRDLHEREGQRAIDIGVLKERLKRLETGKSELLVCPPSHHTTHTTTYLPTFAQQFDEVRQLLRIRRKGRSPSTDQPADTLSTSPQQHLPLSQRHTDAPPSPLPIQPSSAFALNTTSPPYAQLLLPGLSHSLF